MKIFIYMLITLSTVTAEFQTIFSQSINLDKNKTGKLSLQVEERDYLATDPARIVLDYEVNTTKKQYIFIDPSKKFPIYYFDKMLVNTKKDKIVNLTNSINIFDIDNDRKNEIFIYGRSYYGVNGHVGKVVVLKEDASNIIQQIGMIKTINLSEINYIEKENIIVVAQSIWGSQLEEHSKNEHRYEIDIYEIDNKFNKVPILTTQKKYNDQNSSVISDVLDKALSKYSIYKKNELPPNTETNTTVNLSHKDKIYHYLKEELKAGYSHGNEAQAMDMDRAYFSVVGEELRQYLTKYGFRFLDHKTFKNKIKEILGLDEKQFLYESNRDYMDTVALPFALDLLTFLPDKGLLTFAYKMPEIIDYQKLYPELVKFEDNVNDAYEKSGNKKQRVSWKSRHEDYTRYTQNNLFNVLALNRYLLNDDLSQRSWLVENTYNNMYVLYIYSGYRKDKGLLKALLKEKVNGKHEAIEWHTDSHFDIRFLLVLPKKIEGHYVVREEAFIKLSELIQDDEKKFVQSNNSRRADGKIPLLNVNEYLDMLGTFVERHDKDESYKSVVEYILKFIKKEAPPSTLKYYNPMSKLRFPSGT